ncbi:MAG: alanine racemase [Acidobacteriota bacterium]|nr:alanine racemase [Acidobacteriota bacterium]
MRSWIEVSEAALAGNLQALRQTCGPETEVLSVVKANAYGHGAEVCAQALARAGARWFGVTDAAEGARVRVALNRAHPGRTAEIVVMCGCLPEETALVAEHALTPVVWTTGQIAALRSLQEPRVQIEIDTGMSRQGVAPGYELDGLLAEVCAAGMTLDGVFTHLASAEMSESSLTRLQRQRFERAVEQVRARGMRPNWLHIGNSSSLDNVIDADPISSWLAQLAARAGARAMVRSGLALYGYTLGIEHGTAAPLVPPAPGVERTRPPAALRPRLTPVLTWKTRILSVRSLAVGDTVGYGATFTAHRAMRVALLPVGYADGLRRELSNPAPLAGTGRAGVPAGGWVIAEAADGSRQRCAILGRLSMNLTVVDISAVPTLAAGDPVTVLGPGSTAEDHARLAGTIPYEILCGLRAPSHLI